MKKPAMVIEQTKEGYWGYLVEFGGMLNASGATRLEVRSELLIMDEEAKREIGPEERLSMTAYAAEHGGAP